MPSSNKFRITQTLLSAWQWSYKLDDGYEKFLKTLNRQKEPPTKAMLDGIRFEGLVNAVCEGQELEEDHEWHACVNAVAGIVKGAQQQVTLFRETTVDGVRFLLHGVEDFLKAGVIYDTKFSRTYEVGKYLTSSQHPMYFALTPEAYEFQYIICDGKYVYKEKYRPEDCKPIEQTISHFMRFLERQNLVDLYCEKWAA